MINLNPNVAGALPNANQLMPQIGNAEPKKADFANTIKAVEKFISKVDDLQQSSDASIKDLLAGRQFRTLKESTAKAHELGFFVASAGGD